MLSLLAAIVFQQLGPVLPVGAAPHVAQLNLGIQTSLQAGDFAKAQAQLADWPSGRLSYQMVGLPSNFKVSVDDATALVKEASGGRVEFVAGESPILVLTFGALPPEGPKDPIFRNGSVHVEVPITDRDGNPASPRSVAAATAKGMAYAAGLDVSTRRRSLMGPLVYTKSAADPTYSPREQALFHQIEDVRLALEKAVRSKTKLSPALPVISVSPDVVDFGVVTQGDREEFSITIANTGNAAAIIEIETTCACIVAQPSFVILPGEKLTQKPRFDSTDYDGHLEKHLYVLSNAPATPRQTVVMKGIIVPEVRFMEPKGAKPVHSNVSGGGLYEIEVQETGHSTLDLLFYGTAGPVELVDLQLGNPVVKAQFVPFSGSVNDPMIGTAVRSGSKVTLTFPDSWPFGINWLRVVGITNSRRKPSVEMTLQIRKGIAASPQSMYFGDAKVGQSSDRSVMIEHASRPFAITKIEASENVSALFEKSDVSGKRYKVVAKIRPTSSGPISGSITVSTDSPVQPTITIPVGGQAG